MVQVIAFVIFLIIAKLIVDFIKDQFSFTAKDKKKEPSGEVIDISDAWVDTSTLPYQKKEKVLNQKELSFYNLLAETVAGKDYIICPHMQMSELISVTESSKQLEYAQRLKERTLDLVLFEAGSFKPLLAFHLEASEPGKNKQISNRFTAKALQAAGLPMIGINLNQLPKPQHLLDELRKQNIDI